MKGSETMKAIKMYKQGLIPLDKLGYYQFEQIKEKLFKKYYQLFTFNENDRYIRFITYDNQYQRRFHVYKKSQTGLYYINTDKR